MSCLGDSTCDNTPLFSLDASKMNARVLSVHDGDTVQIACIVFGKMYRFNARLNGIDTLEMTGIDKNGAIQARTRLLELCTGGIRPDSQCGTRQQIQSFLQKYPAHVYVICNKFDKYGRILIDIKKSDTDEETFSDILLKEKLAKSYDGKTKIINTN